VLADGRFDRVVCHAPWSQALFGGVARRAGVPLVFWAHDAMRGRHWTERLARRVRPDLVICNSEFTAATLPRLYPDVHHLVVYAPVATSPRGIDNEERQRLRAALETAGEATVLVQASRSEPWKGHETLVAALTRLRAMPGWIWWQVGGAQRPAEARFLARLREQAERCGIADRVRWVGERPDVPRLLAAADIYCQANVMPEPFGVVFVEALAAGLPVVSTRLGGVREIVDDTCGVLVPPADPAALADALGELIVDATRRRALARQAAARAKRLCDPPTQLQRLESALHAMVPAAISA
jgi:glycosyltransferase involved in cell wall biosynthesis